MTADPTHQPADPASGDRPAPCGPRMQRPRELSQCVDIVLRPRMPEDIPNLITVARLALTVLAMPPLAAAFLATGDPAWMWALFVTSATLSATDWADGFLARRYGWTSPFGAWLDPLSDKLYTLVSWLMLIVLIGVGAAMPGVALAVGIVVSATLVRERLVTRWRAVHAFPAGMWGKVKTVLQMAAILTFWLALNPDLGFRAASLTSTDTPGNLLFLVASALLVAQLAIAWYSALLYHRMIRARGDAGSASAAGNDRPPLP